MRLSPPLVRTPQRQLSVTCEGHPSRLAVGRRPRAAWAAAEVPAETVVAEAAVPWSRGLWGVFLPERRQRPAAREGQPERRRDAA